MGITCKLQRIKMKGINIFENYCKLPHRVIRCQLSKRIELKPSRIITENQVEHESKAPHPHIFLAAMGPELYTSCVELTQLLDLD